MEEIIDKFNVLTAKPVKYLAVQDEVKNDVKNLIKTLYDFTKSQDEGGKKKNDALPHLLVDDFDEEQIWQQVELQNSQCWDQLVWEVANCVSNKTDLTFPVTIAKQMDTDELNSQLDNNTIPKKKSKLKANKTSKIKKQKEVKKPSKTKESIVDDDFFKLKDMEKFLLKEERDDGKKKDSDEESIDFFDDIEDDSGDERKENGVKYSDFFDDGEDTNDEQNYNNNEDEEGFSDEMEENDLEIGEETPKTGDKKVRFADQPESSSSDESETENQTNITDKSKNKLDTEENKSEFEKCQQRLQQQISRLEEKTLKEAPWQLKGEVDASKRPQNSLLEEVVDFDLTTRPPPIITEQTTITLEEIIQRRVKDKAWDDVERKEKPVDDQLAFRKPEVLDHAKSKLSLAQVYEAEYLKQKHGEPEEENEPQEHKELRDSMEKLFSKLDALCNYHYTPKPPQAEVKIVSNTPAISMEEVAPVATSEAALLAPEEVKKKLKGDLLSKDERTQTDKKRERRKKKKLQHLKGNVTKVTENRNTKKGVESNDKSIKTSKAFFQQLNDDSNSVIKLKGKRKNKGQ